MPETRPVHKHHDKITIRRQRLLKFAFVMWWLPLSLATVVLLAFLLTESLLFTGLGLVLIVLGGLCALSGIIAILVILTDRKPAKPAPPAQEGQDTPVDNSEHRALITLGLLLSNFAVAALYSSLGLAQLDPTIMNKAVSPSGEMIAELSLLGEGGKPPYGQSVSLRPTGNPFKAWARKIVFSAHCTDALQFQWNSETELAIRCRRPAEVHVWENRYRKIVVVYENAPTAKPAVPPRKPARTQRNANGSIPSGS